MVDSGLILDAMSSLTPKQEAFAMAVADLKNPKSKTDAYRLVFKTDGMKHETVHRRASLLAAEPPVAARIEQLLKRSEEFFVFKQLDVLKEWMAIATADPSELTKLRQFACRHCYGIDHRYQWADDVEYANAVDIVIEANALLSRKERPKPMPDCSGGFGFDRLKPPVAGCLGCQGDGLTDVWITPTEQLTPQGRKLFAGIKQTRDGVQVLMRDQDGALANIARFLGMFVDKREISGPNGGPIQTEGAVVTAEMEPGEASKIYQRAMG